MTQSLRLLAVLTGMVIALLVSLDANAQCQVDAGENVSICVGEQVVLGGNPTLVDSGNNPQLSWNNGAGSNANPTVSPASTTTYTVTLESDGGCSTTDQITVTVFQAPTAAFTFNPSGACAASPVQFTNTSVGAGLEYQWNFGNPQSGASNTSTANNPSHQFVAPGNGNQTFTVTLTVTNANGCTASTTQNVPVIQSPDPSLEDFDIFTPFVMCGNAGQAAFDLTINNTSSTEATNTSYTINWGDGTPAIISPVFTSLVHTYSGTGFFDLTLSVTGANGCVNTEVYEVFAGSNPSVGLASPGSTINLCAPNTLDFPITNWQNNSLGTIYTVTFSDGTPPQTFVHPPPATISHIFEESSCGSTSISGFANSYFVRIIAENPCGFSAATIEPIQTSSAPTADFSVSPGLEGCSNAPFTFTNVSTNANFNNNGTCVSLMTANWSIDPPTGWTVTSGSLTNPTSFSATFQPGTYTVTMIGTNPCGSDEISVEICVTPPPDALFTIDPVVGCAPLVVPAQNLSSSLNNCDNETYVWQVFPNTGWNFASGNASSINPTFNFTQAGSYTVQLTVSNVCGSDVYTQNVTVYQPPTVNLASIASACEGVTINPSATYTTGGTPITSYSWSFPGGSPTSSNQANPGAVNYPNNGNFTVSVTATNLCGSATDSESFAVESAPVVLITPENPELCVGTTVALQASGAVTYTWNASPSLNTTSGANVTATPGSTTTYTVTGTSSAGCTATVNATVDVNPNPTLTSNGPYVVCAGECIDISVSAFGGQQPYSNYQWSPATGLSVTNMASVQACLNATQTYTVSVTDANGCVGQTTVTVTVNPLPVVNAGSDLTLCDQPVPEQLAGFTPPGGQWTGPFVTTGGAFTPNGTGSFTLTYTFVNANGCENSDEVVVTVIDPVAVDAGIDLEFCSGIGAQQLVPPTAGGSWSGTGVTSNGVFNPTTPGTYTLTYSLGGGSCLSSDAIVVEVFALPVANAGNDVSVCAGEDVQLNGSVIGGALPYNQVFWTASPALSDASVLDPLAAPTQTSTFTLNLVDANGCVANDNVVVSVLTTPIVNAGNDLTLCDQPVPEQLTGFSPAGGQWSGPFVTTGGAFTPNGTGSFTLTYTFVNASGCENSDEVVVTVVDPADVDAGNDVGFCSGIGAQQLAPPTPGGSWSGTGVTSNGLFTPSTPGTYILTYSLGSGSCLASDAIEVEVFVLPVANAGSDVSLCAGDDVQLDGSVIGGALPYNQVFWSASPALNDASVLDPLAAPTQTSTFTLNIVDANGCVASDNVVVSVLTTPIVNAGNDLTLCDQPIPEQLTGFTPNDGTGVWSGNSVSVTGVFTPVGVGNFTLTYTYTNAAGCFASDDLIVSVVDPTTASAGNDFALCVGSQAVNLVAGGTWSGASVSPQGVFTPTNTGVFDLTFTIGTGTCQTSDNLEITVLELPVIDAGSNVFICNEDFVQLGVSAQSSNGVNFTYLWTGVQLSDATIANPTATPSSTSTFSVLVTDETGCQAGDQMVVNVNSLPSVNAGSDLTLCDQAIEESLTGFSPLPNANSTGEWSGIGIVDPAGTFLSPGTGSYTLTYTFTDIAGCVNTDQITVTVIEPVVADAGTAQSICLNNGAYVLQNFSPLNNVTWSGIGITNSNGTFDPLVSGVGDFTLSLEFGAGTCFSSDQVTVTVLPLPVMSVTDNPVFCGNAGISDLGDFSPIGGWWEGTGIVNANLGTFDPSVGQGNYSVFYWYTDLGTGCADTLDVTVSVSPVPQANFNLAAQGCTNAAVDVTNTSVGANFFAWDWGNGITSSASNPSYTYPDEGVYTVELTVENNFGCIEVSTASHEIIHPPQAQITLNTAEGCAPLEVEFTSLSEGQYLSYAWDLDVSTSTDQSPAPVIYQQGDDVVTYNVSLIATNYCGSSQVDEVVTVYPQPIASFGTDFDAFCSPWATQFNNTSVGNPDMWFWDFGDGTSSALEQPISHTYFTGEEPTEYTITLTTTNDCGTDDFSYTITVLPNTVTSFFNTDVTSGCAPLTVEFTDFSTGGTIVAYDFGDDNVSSSNDPVHTFNDAGVYTVYQFVNNGCSFDTTLAFIEVFSSPIANFTANVPNACAGDAVQFINQSTDVNNVSWDFGDGNTSAVTNPQHTYMTGGVYNVTIDVTSTGNECTATITQPFTVYLAPNVNFTVPNQVGCSPFTVNFQNTTTGGSFYAWDFGNGQTANSLNPSQTFLNNSAVPELYTVTLTATSLQLCEASASFDIIVSPTPVSAFTLAQTESCFFPVDVQTTNESLNANGYAWDFGVFGSSQLLNPSFSVDAVGEWPIGLTVSNSFGCENTSIEIFSVNPLPQIGFELSVSSGCIPLTVDFNNTSTGGVSYEWFFGNGATSTAENPQFTYTTHGLYDVSLIVQTQDGCVDTLVVDHQVAAYPLPVAGFSHTPERTTVFAPTVDFTDLSAGASYWFWTFGDGYTSSEVSPSHNYVNPGTYQILQEVTNVYGCSRSAIGTVTVIDQFNVYVPNAFTPDADNVNDVFFPVIVGKGLIDKYELRVFDRWGVEVFFTEDMEAVWLGDFRGSGDYYVQNDIYVWQIKYRLRGAEDSDVIMGHVMQIR